MKTKNGLIKAVAITSVLLAISIVLNMIFAYHISCLKGKICSDTADWLNALSAELVNSSYDLKGVRPEKYADIVSKDDFAKMNYYGSGVFDDEKIIDIINHSVSAFETTVNDSTAVTSYSFHISAVTSKRYLSDSSANCKISWKYEDNT